MKFLILGTLEVRADEALLSLGGAKPRAMLAALLLQPNEVVSAGRLTEALWGEDPPRSAAANLKTYASHLRKALDDGRREARLLTRLPGYLLRVEPGELDMQVFDALATSGQAALAGGDAVAAARQLGEALALWRGDLCADVELGMALYAVRSRLDERRMAVTEDLLQARLHRGEDRDLVPELRELVAAHPLRERLWGYLMLALSRAGRPADALAAYTACRGVLVQELGLEPGKEIQGLQEAILADDVPARLPRLVTAMTPAADADALAAGPVRSPERVQRDPGSTSCPLRPCCSRHRRMSRLSRSCPARGSTARPAPASFWTGPPMTGTPLSGRWWRLGHSAWLLSAFLGLGLTTWVSFLYIGLRSSRRDWVLIAGGYGVGALAAVLVSAGDGDSPASARSTFAGFLLLVLWVGGSIHALAVNGSWLRWRSCRARCSMK
jgi:DNA-binding SARP family transcriptional activator